MIRTTMALAVLTATLVAPAAAQQTIFLVRHAERADAGMKPAPDADPDLSEAGHARAASLATLLKEAGITAIFATDRKRTQQTGAPLAKALGLPVITVKGGDTAALLAQLKSAKGNALVIGHTNTIPAIVKALGVSTPVTIADDEFDKLFILTTAASGSSPSLVTLHFR